MFMLVYNHDNKANNINLPSCPFQPPTSTPLPWDFPTWPWCLSPVTVYAASLHNNTAWKGLLPRGGSGSPEQAARQQGGVVWSESGGGGEGIFSDIHQPAEGEFSLLTQSVSSPIHKSTMLWCRHFPRMASGKCWSRQQWSYTQSSHVCSCSGVLPLRVAG